MNRLDQARWGVDAGYRDVHKKWHDAPGSTVDSVLRAMGARPGREPESGSGPLVLTGGKTYQAAGEWSIDTEAGETMTGSGRLPPDLPLGYHRLSAGESAPRRLIVAPSACPSFADVRRWGWALQLYAMRSRASWGIGDLADLEKFADLAREAGARVVLLNPLHAPLPGKPQQSSPYYPSSREFRSPLYLRIEDVPGADRCVDDIDRLATVGRELNENRRIDRNTVWTLKFEALERIWRATSTSMATTTATGSSFDKFVEREGDALLGYATFCSLSEEFGRPWEEWPAALRHPSSVAVAEFARSHADRVRFHQWIQWLIERQLEGAASHISLVQDLAIGVDPAGADAWLWQDAIALDMRVGAPPDEFNTRGQDWGLPPFDPWRLRDLDYEPFVRIIRAGLMESGGMRIDHVMGLFRLFWIPEGARPSDGTYVNYPWRDLLAILALESTRAGAYVIGEDLGTVEPYMREELAARNIASYKLLWFEDDPPADYPQEALAAVTTHDLPTIAGLWTGSDLELQHRLGTEPNEAAGKAMLSKFAGRLDCSADAPVAEVTEAAHRMLAAAPSALVTATLEDALCVEERPNYPGTTDQWPNWSVALPVTLDDLESNEGFCRTATALALGRATTKGSPISKEEI